MSRQSRLPRSLDKNCSAQQPPQIHPLGRKSVIVGGDHDFYVIVQSALASNLGSASPFSVGRERGPHRLLFGLGHFRAHLFASRIAGACAVLLVYCWCINLWRP
jgi:hypothetical protein